MSSTTSTTLPIAKAITAGLRDAMTADERVLLMGEDIGPLGGVSRDTDGLHAEFGDQRVVDTPLAEAGIVGTAVGLAFRGYRPVVEIQFDGFVYPAYNQITTQVAKMHNRTSGRVNMPMVIRIPHGGGIGAVEHHSESPAALFAHTAGLRILAPSTAQDTYWMTRQAIESEDPVIMLEPKRRYWVKGDVDPGLRPALSPSQAAIFPPDFYGVPLGVADYLLIVLVSVLGSAATAGMTGATVMLTLTLSTLGLPLEGVGLLLAIDPILDMGRTALNVTGQSLVGVIVAKREKILDQDTYDAAARTSFSAIQAEQAAESDAADDAETQVADDADETSEAGREKAPATA